MAYNLSAYYRYTTRMERETASLDEEIKLLVNYLDIQKLRNARIDYHIEIPENMLSQSVPRLMLQPIVENSVIHGVPNRIHRVRSALVVRFRTASARSTLMTTDLA